MCINMICFLFSIPFNLYSSISFPFVSFRFVLCSVSRGRVRACCLKTYCCWSAVAAYIDYRFLFTISFYLLADATFTHRWLPFSIIFIFFYYSQTPLVSYCVVSHQLLQMRVCIKYRSTLNVLYVLRIYVRLCYIAWNIYIEMNQWE